MDNVTPLDWGILVATAVTAAFTGWAIWQRWRYTPRPLWVPPRRAEVSPYWQGGTQGAQISWKVENRGDAPAFDVVVFVSTDEGKWRELDRSDRAVIETGEAATAWTDVAILSGDSKLNQETLQVEDTREYGPTPARAQLRWRQHPNLGRVKRQSFPLPRPLRD